MKILRILLKALLVCSIVLFISGLLSPVEFTNTPNTYLKECICSTSALLIIRLTTNRYIFVTSIITKTILPKYYYSIKILLSTRNTFRKIEYFNRTKNLSVISFSSSSEVMLQFS